MKTRSPARLLALALCLINVSCAQGSPLTSENLKTARDTWSSAGHSSYQLVLEITGDTIEAGTFEVEVQNGAITHATRNERDLTTPDTFYTIAGLFKFLEDELALAKEPGRYFGAGPDARIYMKAHFDPKTGAPLRYLRAITETRHNIVVEIKSLRPR